MNSGRSPRTVFSGNCLSGRTDTAAVGTGSHLAVGIRDRPPRGGAPGTTLGGTTMAGPVRAGVLL